MKKGLQCLKDRTMGNQQKVLSKGAKYTDSHFIKMIVMICEEWNKSGETRSRKLAAVFPTRTMIDQTKPRMFYYKVCALVSG